MEVRTLMIIASMAAIAVVAGGATLVIVNDSDPVYSLTLDASDGGSVDYEHLGDNDYLLKAKAKEHYQFDGWYVGSSCLSTQARYECTLEEDTLMKARFSLIKYQISTGAKYDGGSVVVEGTPTYGKTVTLKQTPKEGFVFNGWYHNGTCVSKDQTYSFKVDGDGKYSADYIVDHNPDVRLTTKDIGSPTDLHLVIPTDAVFKVQATYYYNDNWLTTTPLDVHVTQPGVYKANVTIQFIDGHQITKSLSIDVKQRYTAHISSNAGGDVMFMKSNGTSGKSMDYLKGDDIFMKAVPDYGYDFDHWIVNNGIYSNKNTSVSLTANKNYEIKAVFVPHKFAISYNVNYPNGVRTVSIPSAVDYLSYADVSLQVNPGYVLNNLSVNGGVVSTSNTARFLVVKDSTVSVNLGLSHDVSFSYSKSSTMAPTTFTLSVSPMIKDAQYTVRAYDSWDGIEELYNGVCSSGQTIEMDDYGLFNAALTVSFADGYTSTKSIDNVVVDGIKTNSYSWKYQTKDWLTSLPFLDKFNNHSESISYDLHFSDYYKWDNSTVERNRIPLMQYADFVKYNDPYVRGIAEYIQKITKDNSSLERANCALKFVQSFSYAYDDDQFGCRNYAMYPFEMLWTKKGDCEDHAILYASIMKAMGYDVILLYVNTPESAHLAVGLNHEKASGSYFMYNGCKYYYCEATSTYAGDTYENSAEIGYRPDDWVPVTGIPIR